MIYLTVAGTVAVIVLSTSTLSKVYAGNTEHRSSFISALANKLGVSEDKVTKAIEEARITVHDEMITEAMTKVNQAIKDGKLTQRQATIVKTMWEIKKNNIGEGYKGAMRLNMLDKLNEKGLKVTQEEMDELRDSLDSLGIVGFGHRGMHRRM